MYLPRDASFLPAIRRSEMQNRTLIGSGRRVRRLAKTRQRNYTARGSAVGVLGATHGGSKAYSRPTCHHAPAFLNHWLDSLTLRTGYSPADARFSDAASATPPRRASPVRSTFLAALWSRCRLVPHSG